MTVRRLAPALVLTLLTASASAQEPPATPATPSGPSAELQAKGQQLQRELQQVSAQLEPLRQQAMETEALAARAEQLSRTIEAKMVEADPAVKQTLARLEALQTQLDAGEVPDADRMAVMMEGQQLVQSLQTAQQAVLATPEMNGVLETFQAAVEARMVEIDPTASALLARYESLQNEARALMRQMPAMAPSAP